jgi:hypothetical protein
MRRLLAVLLFLLSSVIASAGTPISIALIINGTGGSVAEPWPGGVGVFAASSSNWNSGTVTLEVLGPDGVTFIAAGTNTTCTANCVGVFYLPPGKIEAVITGSPTAVYAQAAQVQAP